MLSKKIRVIEIDHTCFLASREFQLAVALFPTIMGAEVTDRPLFDILASLIETALVLLAWTDRILFPAH